MYTIKINPLFIIAVFASIISVYQVKAQPAQDLVKNMMPKPVPVSPNVASLGEFGTYPVSHFSGLPQISIPIYEIQSGSLKVPVTLNYHASGIKPTDVASWVGMGWSLSTGGQVSRSIVGKPDEEDYLTSLLNTNPSVCGSFYYLLYSNNHVTDTEPDIFSYSFGDKSGKFILPYNSDPYLIPYAPLKLVPDPGLGSFEITDENGIFYSFGKNDEVEVTTATNGGNPSFSGTTAWHLSEIAAPNSDDKITYEYQDVGTYYTHDISYSYTITDECHTENGGGPCPGNTFAPQQHNLDSYGNQIGPLFITFETGKVKFILGGTRSDASTLKYLDRIEIQDLNGEVQKTIKFIYSYFTNANAGNSALKLDAVQFLDRSGVLVNQYKLEYFTNAFSWNVSNSRFLNARDLWGYYNGATTNTDLLLPTSISYQELYNTQPVDMSIGGGVNRDVNPTYVKEGVLKKIIFPTGGYTEFDFEPNQYMKGETPSLAGGLRVTKITSSDGTNALPIVKTYKYGNGESGYGVANFTDMQFNYSNTQLYVDNTCNHLFPLTEYRIRTYQSNSAFAYDNFDASPVLYNHVTEYIGDPSGNINGKTEYVYDKGTSSTDINQVVPQSSKYYRNSFSWRRGKLTKKIVYDEHGNKLSETIIDYSLYNNTEKTIGVGAYLFFPIYSAGVGNCHPNCWNEANELVYSQALTFRVFSQNSGVMLPTSISETTYENGDINRYVSSLTSNTYDAAKLQLTQSIRKRSNNPEQVVTVNRYPFQLAGSVNAASTGNAKGIYMLNNKNILTTPVESFTYLQNSNGTNQRIISGQVTTFRENEATSGQVVADVVFQFESSAPLIKNLYVPMGINGSHSGITEDSHYKPRIRMVRYDADGNILEAQKVNDQSLSYKWAYDNSLPVAEITNAPYKNVFYTSFEEDISNTAAGGKTGEKSAASGFSKTLTGLEAGPYTLSYYQKQGSAWALQQSPVTVGTSGQYTISITGQVDEVRFYPAGAQMTTYTYDPVMGITSKTDANSFVTYFKYDDFMRLKAVKDSDQFTVSTYKYNYNNQD